jgi:hypothetical protein
VTQQKPVMDGELSTVAVALALAEVECRARHLKFAALFGTAGARYDTREFDRLVLERRRLQRRLFGTTPRRSAERS